MLNTDPDSCPLEVKPHPMKTIYMHMIMFASTRNRIVNGPKAVNYSTKAQAMVRTLCSTSLPVFCTQLH